MQHDAPLPIPPGIDTAPDDFRDRMRAVFSQSVSDIADRLLEDVLLPADRMALCLDFAQFTTFIMAVKLVEIDGTPCTRENLMRHYWPMQKALKDEVPGMLRNLADAVAAGDHG